MNNLKKNLFAILIITISAVNVLGCYNKDNGESTIEANSSKDERKLDNIEEIETSDNDKGYNLPVNEENKVEITSKCVELMNSYKDLYLNSETEEIGPDLEKSIMECLGRDGKSVAPIAYNYNMLNWESLKSFIEKASNGEVSEGIVYRLNKDGGMGIMNFSFDGNKMYLLYTSGSWNKEGQPVINSTSYTRIENWSYTEKGWFSYELCVPQFPEVSEVVIGDNMLRVEPLSDEYRNIANKYLLPIGYMGNNLFISQWDENNMENIDYNGLFEYLYILQNGQRLDSEEYLKGIPKEEFENIFIKYLPVSKEILSKKADFNIEENKYIYLALGCYNYNPTAFGTSIPEITNMEKNSDGTTTITIDAVCEMMGDDKIFTHTLTVQFLENDEIKYLRNEFEEEYLEQIPTYVYRLE